LIPHIHVRWGLGELETATESNPSDALLIVLWSTGLRLRWTALNYDPSLQSTPPSATESRSADVAVYDGDTYARKINNDPWTNRSSYRLPFVVANSIYLNLILMTYKTQLEITSISIIAMAAQWILVHGSDETRMLTCRTVM